MPLAPENDVSPGESPLVEARVWESYLFAKNKISESLIMIEKCREKEYKKEVSKQCVKIMT